MPVADTPERSVVSHQVCRGKPDDADTIGTTIADAKKIGVKLRPASTDRGYRNAVPDRAVDAHDIENRAIPRTGKAAEIETPVPGAATTTSSRHRSQGQCVQTHTRVTEISVTPLRTLGAGPDH